MIELIKTEIKDVLLLRPNIYTDKRGYFLESYNKNLLMSKGLNFSFIQDNESKSDFGVLRGIHFQKSPFEQSKLIRVVIGKIQDVVIDLRPSSSTYRQYISFILDDKKKEQLIIPKGFGHAFLVLSKYAIVLYKTDSFYNIESESGIKYDDPTININWELNKNEITLSDKDSQLPYL